MSGAHGSFLICVTGAECTGKSTLAGYLATAFDVPLVPEVARAYLDDADQSRPGRYRRSDVEAIARAQLEAETTALAAAPLVVADTDLTVIRVWWEEKFGPLPDWLRRALDARGPRCYLVPRPDIPWEHDPQRENPHDRARLHQRYLALLRDDPFEFTEVHGLGPRRQEQAAHWVRQRLRPASRLRTPSDRPPPGL